MTSLRNHITHLVTKGALLRIGVQIARRWIKSENKTQKPFNHFMRPFKKKFIANHKTISISRLSSILKKKKCIVNWVSMPISDQNNKTHALKYRLTFGLIFFCSSVASKEAVREITFGSLTSWTWSKKRKKFTIITKSTVNGYSNHSKDSTSAPLFSIPLSAEH